MAPVPVGWDAVVATPIGVLCVRRRTPGGHAGLESLQAGCPRRAGHARARASRYLLAGQRL